MPAILIVDDDAALRADVSDTLKDFGYEPTAVADGSAALELLDRFEVAAVLLDLRMPGLDGMEVLRRIRARPAPPPVAILTAVPTADNTIEAMRLGAVDHMAKPVKRAELAALLHRLLPAIAAAEAAPAAVGEDGAMVGASAAMREVQKAIGKLADLDATVLITGETGTGKEVVARALHRHGKRAQKPFVAINCAAIPTELLESELFGHVRGAFTGAVTDRQGSFRDAQGGTVFMDEIGDMDLAMQAKMLRVIQEREVVPVGGRPVRIDVRIVAATHRDLAAAVRVGRFREDLFYRLGVVPLRLPPLRERLADTVPLAEHFLALCATGGAPKVLSVPAAERLVAHAWPGNVRELRNVMERASAMSVHTVLQASDFDFLQMQIIAGADSGEVDSLPEALRRLEEEIIKRALAATGGNRTEAARRLGIHRQLLHTRMRFYGMDVVKTA